MSGGHGHDAHDAHGTATHGGHAAAAHGHGGEIPPAPATRMISPAREEYEQPWPGNLLLWPVVWFGVALLLFQAARTWSHDWSHDAHADGGAHGQNAAPARAPAPSPDEKHDGK